jgi:hypothetical protein
MYLHGGILLLILLTFENGPQFNSYDKWTKACFLKKYSLVSQVGMYPPPHIEVLTHDTWTKACVLNTYSLKSTKSVMIIGH